MLVFRAVMILMVVLIVVSMMFYAATGEVKYRRFGLLAMKWLVLAALGFFSVLLLERLF
ncbi:MAG: hypothetical protein RLZZ612_2074 [Pseudomonadota bacterium]|jgi:hypothetical protein